MTGRRWRIEADRLQGVLREHAMLCPLCLRVTAERAGPFVHMNCEAGAVILADLTIARCHATVETQREQVRAVTSPPARVSQ